MRFRAKVDTYKNFRYLPKGSVIEESEDFESPNFEPLEHPSSAQVMTEPTAAAPTQPTTQPEVTTVTTEVTNGPDGALDDDEMAIRAEAQKLGIANWHTKGIKRLKTEIEEAKAAPNFKGDTTPDSTGDK